MEARTLKDYDSEPVEYCARCFSLKIRHEDAIDSDCCMECGSTETATTDIGTWERMYEARYGHKYIRKTRDFRDSLYFRMTVSKLKMVLYESSILDKIIYRLYPKFPKGLSREEKVILLFDRLSQDNRIDDLRYQLCLCQKDRMPVIKDNIKSND